MAWEGKAGGTCDLFARGTASDSSDDRGIPAGCGARPERLSPSVAVDPVGVEEAKSPDRLSPERFQSAMCQLQPGIAGRCLRGLQGRRILARAEREVLSGMGRKDDAGGGSLRPQMVGHVSEMCGLFSCAQSICPR